MAALCLLPSAPRDAASLAFHMIHTCMYVCSVTHEVGTIRLQYTLSAIPSRKGDGIADLVVCGAGSPLTGKEGRKGACDAHVSMFMSTNLLEATGEHLEKIGLFQMGYFPWCFDIND